MCAPKGASPSWASLTLSTVATRSSGKHGAHDVPVEPACKAAGLRPAATAGQLLADAAAVYRLTNC